MKLKSKEKLGLPVVFFSCCFSLLAGFYGAVLLSQEIAGVQPRRVLESVEEESEREFDLLPYGETGEGFIASISFQVLSWKPRALYFPNFATPQQCRSIIEMAKPNLTPSTLVLRNGETEESTKGIRTSTGVFIGGNEDRSGILDLIERKIARVTMLPQTYGEPFNILRYEIGQKYDSHYDLTHPDEDGEQKSQRVASFLLYLTDIEEGGETMFPYENGLNMDGSYDYKKCIDLKVKPRQGDGLLFYSLFPNHTVDDTSLHGSCPVIRGEKWVATKWIRDRDY